MPNTPAADTSARLLRLLALLQSHPDRRGPDLAHRLGVTTRTIRRDIERLRDLGYPIHASPGTTGGYRLGAGSTLPPLLLDDEEALAVAVGLRSAAAGAVTGLAEAGLRALAKLDQLLPTRLRRRLHTLHAATVPIPDPGPTVDPTALTTIATACRAHQHLRMTYRDNTDVTSIRTIEPYRLVHTGRRWYLLAYDGARADWRTFRVDRISEPAPTGHHFPPRPAPDPAAHVSAALATGPYPHRARIRLHTPAAEAATRIPATVGLVEPDGEHHCLLTTGAHSLDAIAAHLALLDLPFRILHPPALAERARAMAARLADAATTDDHPA